MSRQLPSRPFRSKLLGLAVLACARTALAEKTCGTSDNPDCGLHTVLHWLVVTAIILGVILVAALIIVVRYYRKTKDAKLDPESLHDF